LEDVDVDGFRGQTFEKIRKTFQEKQSWTIPNFTSKTGWHF